jgi:hypothetical protein
VAINGPHDPTVDCFSSSNEEQNSEVLTIKKSENVKKCENNSFSFSIILEKEIDG